MSALGPGNCIYEAGILNSQNDGVAKFGTMQGTFFGDALVGDGMEHSSQNLNSPRIEVLCLMLYSIMQCSS